MIAFLSGCPMTVTKRKRTARETGKPTKKPRRRDVRKRKAEEEEPVRDKPKRTREDVAQRKKEGAQYQNFVVKASLRGRIAPYSDPIRVIVGEAIDKYVETVSQMVVRGSMVANEALLVHLRTGSMPQLGSTFFRHCMVAESNDPIITGVLREHFGDHPGIQRVAGDWVPLNYAANLLYTNFDNDLWMRFDARFASFVRDWVTRFDFEKDLCASIICHVLGRSSNKITVLPREVWDFIDEQKTELRRTEDPFIAERTPSSVLVRYLFKILLFRETFGLPGRFSIVPISKVKRHHVTIDTTTLHSMTVKVFNSLGEDAPRWAQEVALLDMSSAIKEYRHVIWSQLVDYTGLSRHEFCNSITTDGIQASFHFRRPKVTDSASPTCLSPEARFAVGCFAAARDNMERVIAIDPGRVNIIAAYDPVYDQFYTFSRRSYYQPIKKSLEKIKIWEAHLQGVFNELSMYSLRTSDRDMCIGYRRVYFQQYNRLWSARLHKKRSRESFRIFSVKRSCMDRFLMSFMKGGLPKPTVLYGGAPVSSHGAGELSVPVKAVLQRCRQFYTTVLVNEYLTTKCHSECGARMHPVKNRGSRWSVRGVCYCSVCKRFVDRDRDACKSILQAGMMERRPFYLRFTRPFQYTKPLIFPRRQ